MMILKLAKAELTLRRQDILMMGLLALVYLIVCKGLPGPEGFSFALPLLVTVISITYCIRVMQKEVIEKVFLFLRTLPLSPLNIVLIKLVTTSLVVLFIMATSILSTTVFARTHLGYASFAYRPIHVFLALGVGLLMMAFSHAIYFRFGTQPMLIVFQCVFLLAFMPILLFYPGGHESNIGGKVSARIISLISKLKDNSFLAGTFITALIIILLILFWGFAHRAISKKEILY